MFELFGEICAHNGTSWWVRCSPMKTDAKLPKPFSHRQLQTTCTVPWSVISEMEENISSLLTFQSNSSLTFIDNTTTNTLKSIYTCHYLLTMSSFSFSVKHKREFLFGTMPEQLYSIKQKRSFSMLSLKKKKTVHIIGVLYLKYSKDCQ